MSLWGLLLNSRDVQAMSLEQMKMLAGTSLLDVRVDALFRRCGLPAAIVDSATDPRHRQILRWKHAQMKLSPLKWDVIYSRQREVATRDNAWINPAAGGVACLAGLSGLVLQARGAAGILSVTKRADNQGYLTSYQVPKDPYAAHQVIGITGSWKQGMSISRIHELYGKPDEILERQAGIKHYRYWVVAKQNEMPKSVHAVEFEVLGAEKVCTQYTVQTSGFEFVQEQFDALLRQWEKDYVFD